MTWPALLVLAAGAYAFKALGLIVVGGAPITQRLAPYIGLIPAALFTALIMVQTFEADGSLVIDARAAGVAAAVVATRHRVPFVGVIALAMVVTAALRALS